MWVAKLIVPSSESHLLGSRTRKFEVSLVGYPISNSFKGSRFFVTLAGTLLGTPKNKKSFLRDATRDKRVVNVEVNGNFILAKVEQPMAIRVLYDPSIIHVKPIIVTDMGDYVWEIASWEKDKIIKVAKFAEAYGGRLLWASQKKIKNIAVTTILPELTDKQRAAIELAINNGYYEHPRKIKLKQLAAEMGVSYSTYHFHLRVAEKKLFPALFRRI